MKDAVAANEFGRLGEVIIMTKPLLRLVLGAAADMPRTLDDSGLANFIIGSAKLYSDDIELVDPKDRKLAEVLFLHGEWPAEGPFAIMDEGGIAGVEFIAAPEVPSDQGLDGIGWASRIFTRFYATQTIDGDQVIQLNGDAAPEWFAPLAAWDFKNSKLPLWLGLVARLPIRPCNLEPRFGDDSIQALVDDKRLFPNGPVWGQRGGESER